jgi:peptidyl-tRNA hydrolase, PTH1 family
MNKFIILALGNIGLEYAETRHNIGFKIADFIAEKHSATFMTDRYCTKTEIKIKGRVLYIIKPTTYMNLSGKALKYWSDKLGIPIENTFTLVDDLALDFGKIRIKKSGSDGGHNGLKSIAAEMNTINYPRLRFGVGSEFGKGQQVDYVLGDWNEEEKKTLLERIEICANAVTDFALMGLDKTMNAYNNK